MQGRGGALLVLMPKAKNESRCFTQVQPAPKILQTTCLLVSSYRAEGSIKENENNTVTQQRQLWPALHAGVKCWLDQLVLLGYPS